MSIDQLRRYLIGQPFPTSMEIHERLDKVRALAIFASDPISSNAYATEAMMTVLVVLGSAGLSLTLPLGIGVALLVVIVISSYIQTIFHYPDGGGAYTVSRENLGEIPSLIAAAALLTDYVLTVSVSVSAGVRAMTSAFPELFDYRVLLALLAIAFITWINLRGVRESGSLFAIPTYAFVLGGLSVVVLGLLRSYGMFGLTPLEPGVQTVQAQVDPIGFAYIWLLLRAFAGGCTALTGIEAISNGVRSFKPPEPVNAIKTMVAMAVMALSLFLGITYLATHIGIVPSHAESVLSQLTRQIAGRGFLYFWVQAFTMTVLILAANTGFQAFPQLASFLARDGYLPRWLQNRGDRLVFSYGIVVLSLVSSLIVIIFRADEIAMLPLYALGVMLSFSLSQTGMFRLMGRIAQKQKAGTANGELNEAEPESGLGWKRALNGFGAVITAVVFIVLTTTKFLDGAWIVIVLIPLLVGMFLEVQRHYQRVASALRLDGWHEKDSSQVGEVVLVPIGDVHRGVLRALKYARRLAKDVRAICITTSPEMRKRVETRWARFPEITAGVELVLIDYDYRDVMTPLVDYIERVNQKEFPDQLITVAIPEFVAETLWERLLHNQSANTLRRRLHNQQDVVVIDVPYHIVSTAQWRQGTTRAEVMEGPTGNPSSSETANDME